MQNRKVPWYDNPKFLLPLAFVAVCGFMARYCVSEAHAQTVVVFKLLPPGHDGQIQGVGRARYYLLEEYLQLAQFDVELVKLRLDVQAYQGIEKALRSELEAKDTIIKALEDDKKLLTDRGLRLGESLSTCETELVKCSGGTIWPYVVGAVGAVVGAVGLGVYIGTR